MKKKRNKKDLIIAILLIIEVRRLEITHQIGFVNKIFVVR